MRLIYTLGCKIHVTIPLSLLRLCQYFRSCGTHPIGMLYDWSDTIYDLVKNNLALVSNILRISM
jgi:hypothetical protein